MTSHHDHEKGRKLSNVHDMIDMYINAHAARPAGKDVYHPDSIIYDSASSTGCFHTTTFRDVVDSWGGGITNDLTITSYQSFDRLANVMINILLTTYPSSIIPDENRCPLPITANNPLPWQIHVTL